MTRTIEYRLKGETDFQKVSFSVDMTADPPIISGLQPNQEYELRECGSDSIQESAAANDDGVIHLKFTLGGFSTYL